MLTRYLIGSFPESESRGQGSVNKYKIKRETNKRRGRYGAFVVLGGGESKCILYPGGAPGCVPVKNIVRAKRPESQMSTAGCKARR